MQNNSQEFDASALKQVVEQSPVATLITDTKGKIQYINPAFTRITGYSFEEVYGKNPSLLKSGAHDKSFYKDLWHTISNGKTWKGELLNKKKDGSFYWESATISPVFDKYNNIQYYVGSKEDISGRKAAIEEILRTEMQFKNLAESAPVVIAKIDEKGWLLYYNNFLNKDSEKQIETIFDLLEVNELDIFRNSIFSVFKEESSRTFELDCGKYTGEKKTYIVKISPNKHDGVIESAILIAQDITEQKNSQKAILNSEVRFRSFFENSNAIILVIDPSKDKVIDVNKAATEYYGYLPNEFRMLDVQNELVGLVEAAKVEATEVLNDFKNVYAQRHRVKNGEYRDVEILPAKVEVEGEVLVYAIIQDVTQRKKAVEALKESESKKLALLKIIPDLIFVLNSKCEFVDIYTDNPDRLVVPPYKLLGKKCYHIFPGGLCVQLEEKIAKAFETREIQTFEYRYKRDLVNYVVEEIRIIVSGEDEVLAIIRDITTQKKNEIELKRAWEEAKEANRVKDAFVANISHEIRTPINAILGFGELLQSELTNPDHIQYIESIHTSSKSLLNLINDLLDLSKIEAGRMTVREEPVNLRILMSEIENIFSIKLVDKGLDFEINIHDNCPLSLQTDEMRVRQILINLVSNAIKFTQEGCVKVSINAFNSHIVDYVEHVDLKIEVEDTGIGISEENLKQIFVAFQQQEQQDAKKYGGTGLGLTITKRLAELLNGTVEVSSKLGKGSRFTVILYNLEVSQSARQKLAGMDAVYKIGHVLFEPAKVMVADDVQTNRDFLKGIFKGSDMAFIEAADGEQAISLIDEQKPRIALIDIKMPKKDGLEVAKYIKTNEHLKHISTIGISATPVSFETDLRAIYLDEFVPKPIDIAELLRKISYYLPVINTKKEKSEDVKQVRESLTTEKKGAFLQLLEKELTPLFNDILNTSSFEDYNKFASMLIKKGGEFEIKSLTYYGNAIIEATKAFDLEQINHVFVEYKKFVADFSNEENE